MAEYLLVSSIVFICINYKYIYSFIDSNFLYTTSGSKLKLEASQNKVNKINFYHYDKLDIIIVVLFFSILFSINYCISSIAFSKNPLIIFDAINISHLVSNIKVKIIYHILCSLSLVFIIIDNLKIIKKHILKKISKSFEIHEVKKEKESKFLIARDEDDETFYISETALYQNVLITGSIGSGKTSGAIARITSNLIKSGKGGLILDVKGNFVDTVEKMCRLYGRTNDLKIISKASNDYFNILEDNISLMELANRFKQVITLLSINNNTDSYWLDKVENVIMNMFILMRYTEQFDVLTLHKLVTDDEYLISFIDNIKNNVKYNVPDDKTSFELANAISFITNEYLKLDNKVIGIIKSEITRLTIPLVTEYEVFNQFCQKGQKTNISFDRNEIIVLSLNIAQNRILSKIMATFLKLSYQRFILSNIGSEKSHFFISDEFQEFCNSEDAHFFSLSRESKCINIISTQSYSSLKNSLRDENATNVIIQNLVNKIWFRNDDNYTIAEIIKQLGKTNVIRENKSISEGSQESQKYLFKQGFKNKKSSISKSLNYVSSKESEYDENFFSRELKIFEALTLSMTKEGVLVKKVIFERWDNNV